MGLKDYKIQDFLKNAGEVDKDHKAAKISLMGQFSSPLLVHPLYIEL